MKTFNDYFQECPLIAILRGVKEEELFPVCDALYNAGVRLLEITFNTPGADQCIKRATEYAQGRFMVGAGTVLTPEEVETTMKMGGKFIISPNTDPAVIRKTKELGLISIPGFFTATEAFTAIAAGADFLKLFPAGGVGPSYIKDLKAVIKKPILAVGGVGPTNLADFLKVCPGAGIGSSFYKAGKTPEEVFTDSKEIIRIWKQSI